MTQVNKWKGNRREIGEDFFATPTSAILPIKPYIPEGVKTILEPTHGKGAISDLLEEWGYTVILTLFIGFGAIVYLSVCALVTLIVGSDQTYYPSTNSLLPG